ncbi:hypothetical protein [Nesterenkonia pannonica]|uniref:hypothetical protein n=1 Tax=Nesterenkonia pannonica TaxID=1548602 RepID=UPI0021649791|nr:hypothetical protein [Nesterenkonia pannonica]
MSGDYKVRQPVAALGQNSLCHRDHQVRSVLREISGPLAGDRHAHLSGIVHPTRLGEHFDRVAKVQSNAHAVVAGT